MIIIANYTNWGLSLLDFVWRPVYPKKSQKKRYASEKEKEVKN